MPKPKHPDNAIPEPSTRWLNHDAAKSNGEVPPTVEVVAVEPGTYRGVEDHKIHYCNVATGRHGSTSFKARFRLRSAFEPAPIAAEIEPLPVEPSASGSTFDLASFVALLEAQRETTLALQGIAATLVELVAVLALGKPMAAPYPGQAKLPFAIAPVTAGANGAPPTHTNGAVGAGPG